MNIMTISTKQLRENFEQVRLSMQRGQSLILMYRSKPLAEIRPVTGAIDENVRSFSLAQLKDWIKDDELSVNEQKRIDEAIKNFS